MIDYVELTILAAGQEDRGLRVREGDSRFR